MASETAPQKYFDASIRECPAAVDAAEVIQLCAAHSGAIFYGPGAFSWRNAAFACSSKASRWLHAAVLNQPVGADDLRYPEPAPDVIDLQLGNVALASLLEGPRHAWWPLLGSSQTCRFVHIKLEANFTKFPLLRKLAIEYPQVVFLFDAFEFGAESNWMPRVLLAERRNVWLSMIGLAPGPAQCWSNPQCNEALHFATGEVGAGKLLLASGAAPCEVRGNPLAWLDQLTAIDQAQRELIARQNAAELFEVK